MARAGVTGSAADFLPERLSLTTLREPAAGCKGCHLWQVGTQTVFGEGARAADVMLVGEQPGDQEDRVGKPFVGPAGRLLDEALVAAGIDRSTTYVANAVKHFKWEARGKRRIHQKPNWTQHRGELVEADLAEAVTATIHPSAILRGEPEEREQQFAAFVADLRFVASLL